VLDELRRRGLATAVVSNFDRRLPALLEGLGLADRLDAVVLPSDVGATKPDPRIFAAALSRLGRRASEALFVGDDHERDVRGALASGLRAIDVASLANLSELPARLRALEQESA
jgi:putative hydrolase of the HAD superfamily